MLGLFGLGKIQLYIAGAILLVGVYYGWKYQIEQSALLEYNQKQLEQVVKDQQIFQQKMADVESKQRSTEVDLKNQNDEINKKLGDLTTYLSSPDTKKLDRPSSVILKQTILELSGKKK